MSFDDAIYLGALLQPSKIMLFRVFKGWSPRPMRIFALKIWPAVNLDGYISNQK